MQCSYKKQNILNLYFWRIKIKLVCDSNWYFYSSFKIKRFRVSVANCLNKKLNKH